MNFEEKRSLLQHLETSSLYSQLLQLIEDIGLLQGRRQKIIKANADFLASGRRDCEALKALEVDLMLGAPECGADGKKLTVDQRQAWIEKAKRDHGAWQNIRRRQLEVSYELTNIDISIERASRRYGAMKAYLELKAAQIQFLAK